MKDLLKNNMPETNTIEKGKDIYSFGFDKNLNRIIPNASTGVVYDTIENSLNLGSMLSGGNLSLKTLSIGGLVKQVAQGDDINAAIDSVNKEGGGTVQLLGKTYLYNSDIELKSNVVLAGAGKDVTVIDFRGQGFAVICKGSASNIIKNVGVQNLTIQNSNRGAGLDFDFTDFIKVENVRLFSNDNHGIRFDRCQSYQLFNVLSDSNSTNGFNWIGSSTRTNSEFILYNCVARSNSGIGFSLTSSTSGATIKNFSFIGCIADSNTGDGFDFSASGVTDNWDGNLMGCISISNSGIGYDISADVSNIVFVSCRSKSNTGDGFENDGLDISLIGCGSTSQTVNLDINARTCIVGGDFENDTLVTPADSGQISLLSTIPHIAQANLGNSAHTRTNYDRMKNTSGDTIRAGDVVIIKASTGFGEQVDRTTIQGNDKVWGINIAACTNNSICDIQTHGGYSVANVNNIYSSIAVGDLLGTFTESGYLREAVAGDQVIAMSLEAPTLSTASIGILIMSPRLI